jgi:DNA-binding CsgD family transcriptional regulator/tetratricopeptide (TPR) repeat protein
VLRSSALVGRDRELAALDRLLSSVSSGQGGVAVVWGEAGFGKSALVRASVSSELAVIGRALAASGGSLAPVVELVVGLVARGARLDGPGLGVYRPAIAALLPELSRAPAEWRGEPPQPVVLAEALVRLWSTLPVPRRPVLVVEDVHWADEATWAVLHRLCHRVPAAGAALVLTCRPEGGNWPDLHRLVQAREAVGIVVSPLSPDDVAALVAGCLDVEVTALPAGLVDVASAAGGSPLLVEEMMSDLERTGSLTTGPGGWTLDRPGFAVLPSLAGTTRDRLRVLAPAHLRAVERAAVLDGHPDLRLLAVSFGTDLDAMTQASRAGVAAGVLEVDPGTGRLAFRHELVREAVLAGVLEPDRRAHATRLFEAATGLTVDAATPGPRLDITGLRGWLDSGPDDDQVALAARLSTNAGLPAAAGPLHLAWAHRLLARGLPLPAATAAQIAARHPGVRAAALVALVEALALAGEVDRALAAAEEFDGLPGTRPSAPVKEAVARVLTRRGEWDRADRLLEPLRGSGQAASTMALTALIALELGDLDRAREQAGRALDLEPAGAAACQALEVLGRIARGQDLAAAQGWFRRCVVVAEASGLALWRARALHEDATIAQLRSLDVEPLRRARQAAVDAGAPGLMSTVDFHLAAVLGVRFEGAESLDVARRLLVDARAQGADQLQAWAWILIGQAHAVAGHREQADLAAAEALAIAPADAEIEGVAAGTCRALASLLAEDVTAGLAQWQAGIAALRRCRTLSPLPPWYLWAVLATTADVEGDGGLRARRETGAALRTSPGFDGLWHLAEAVAAGRAADLPGAQAAAATAADRFAAVPDFAGWRHLGHRWVAADAIAAGWGEPASWMSDASDWFSDHEFGAAAAACRGLARRAGVPQRRRGRGDAAVPEHLYRLGVTSREVDVLRLLTDGLTNAEIATRLYLSPRTVKGYVEQLLAKTGTTNRTQLAGRLDR